jgi:hypothetical protein
MVRNLAMTFARAVLPSKYYPEVYLASLVRERTGMVVREGSFTGLILPNGARDTLVPKLIGSYERELFSIVEEIVGLDLDRIVNIGAAEGYYAVGLARRIPHAAIVAFEMDEAVRALLSATAAANAVSDRVAVRGKCEPADLRACLRGANQTLVVCDAEGYESVLLDPNLVPELEHSNVLVETHERLCPGITELLQSRFEGSHRSEQIWSEPRSAREYPFQTLYTRMLGDRFFLNAVSEWRSEEQSWLWMSPRCEPSPRPASGSSAPARPCLQSVEPIGI